ncbi:hypothetical protein ON064_00675 [Planococcus sp. A6]|uniref:hypothetical protein n=1 Tax=Planococcus sp. A6 TaxID=2992760 RepID=UPI00237C51A1|nr:hypothetical protein [Planococcus sp. A6]MDE0581563.1 hypothetical protein [Planococcus sp. A6]
MKRMKLFDEIYTAERICKTDETVTGHIGSGTVFKFVDVQNLSLFELLDGAEWDAPEDDELEQFKKRQAASEKAILSLMDMSLMGGI